MDPGAPLPTSVYVIWWLALGVVVIFIVPLAIMLLHRTLRAALSIRRYLREMLEAGAGIAGNTASIAALNDTLAVAGNMVETSDMLAVHSGTIAEALAQRAAEGSQT
ncbi:MAG: hypothetical protein H0W33_00825 [Gammaproteobacteria bacterium]|nr:hypothetical protein [Gammaproteobacteria bacterium]